MNRYKSGEEKVVEIMGKRKRMMYLIMELFKCVWQWMDRYLEKGERKERKNC